MAYWTGSPFEIYSGDTCVFSTDTLYGLVNGFVSYYSAARGVVSLSSESKLLGSGTYNNVYVVS